MPAEHELDPSAMTEEERRGKRRYQAYYAFETMPWSRCANFGMGATDHTALPEEQDDDGDGEGDGGDGGE